jgi:FSR family fosmidomycin resistance protein-like MFS transporter
LQDKVKSLVSTAFAHFINDGSNNTFPVLYPLLQQLFGFANSLLGLLAFTLSGSSIIAAPFIGRRSDVGRNYVVLMVIGILMISVGLIGFPLGMAYFQGSQLLFVLVFFVLVTGFGSSFYHPIGAAILTEKWTGKNRGRAMGLNGSMGALGSMAFPIMAVALITYFSVRAASLLGCLGVVTAVVVFVLLRKMQFSSPSPEAKKTEPTRGAAATSPSEPVTRARPVPLLVVLPAILALTVSAFLRSAFAIGVSQFLPTFLTNVDRVPYVYVGLAVAIQPAMGVISQPLFGYFADRFGRRLFLGVSTVGSIVSILLFISTTNIVLVELCLAMFGLFQYTAFPLLLGLAAEISPRGATTLANSVVWGFGTVAGGAVGSFALGFLSEPSYLGSWSSAFLAVTIIGALSLAFIPFIPRPGRRID